VKNVKSFCLTLGLSAIASLAYADGHGVKPIGHSLHKKEEVALKDVPKSVFEVIKKARPGFKPSEAEKEIKHGNTYFDVEGVDVEGNEIEFDMLLGKDGSWSIAEIQRDLTIEQVPEPVVKIFKSKVVKASPKRIIESDQGNGVTIYEFYTKENGKEHKYEVKLSVEMLKDEWTH